MYGTDTITHDQDVPILGAWKQNKRATPVSFHVKAGVIRVDNIRPLTVKQWTITTSEHDFTIQNDCKLVKKTTWHGLFLLQKQTLFPLNYDCFWIKLVPKVFELDIYVQTMADLSHICDVTINHTLSHIFYSWLLILVRYPTYHVSWAIYSLTSMRIDIK